MVSWKKKTGHFSDTTFTDIAFCDENLHVKEIISTTPHYHIENENVREYYCFSLDTDFL